MSQVTFSILVVLLASFSKILSFTKADKIYQNGQIITMSEKLKLAESVATYKDKIIAVGKKSELEKLIGKNTQIVDLRGKTMVPGFIDAHGHFFYTAEYEYGWANLNSFPIGEVKTVRDIISILKKKAKKVPKGKWILGWGYDHSKLGRHPTKQDLDQVSKNHPIYIQNVTGWYSSSNSLALKIANITKKTKDPFNGKIYKDKNGEPTGAIESAQSPVYNFVPRYTKKDYMKAMKVGSNLYLSEGVTTAQETWGDFNQWKILKEAVKTKNLRVRVNFWPLGQGKTGKSLGKYPNIPSGTSIDSKKMLSLGAVKLTADGSIRGAAHVTKPYTNPPKGEKKGYKGRASHKYKDLEQLVVNLHKSGKQIGIHGNGDAGVDDILKAFKAAKKKYPKIKTRHIIIHNQLVRDDQIKKMKQLGGVIPTFFSSNIYFGGEDAYKLYGKKRAVRLNPAGSALKENLKFTLHSDTYVTPIKPLRMIQSAVERRTFEGRDLGRKKQGIPVYEALKGVTIYAAWQNFEEDIKGSIETGKLADFVILDKNPLEVKISKIADIKVLQTILGGKLAFNSLE